MGQQLRAGLKAIVALFGFYAAVVLFVLPMVRFTPAAWTTGWRAIAATSGAIVVTALLINILLIRIRLASGRTLGWTGTRRGVAGFVLGTTMGLLMAASAVGLAIALGGARLVVTAGSLAAYAAAATSVGFALAVAALAEELLFRGYPLARLSASLGRPLASVVLATLFAVAHGWNPGISVLGVVNIWLAALVLSAAFFTPGGLPAAWGLHLGWNAGLGVVADAPVSGIGFEIPVMEFIVGPPVWLTGGSFGPEGGLVTTAVMVIALVWLIQFNSRNAEDRRP